MTYKVYAKVREDYRKNDALCPQYQYIGSTDNAEDAIAWGNHNIDEYSWCYESYKISVTEN